MAWTFCGNQINTGIQSGEIEDYDHVCGTERGNVERREKMTESLGQKEKMEGRGANKILVGT